MTATRARSDIPRMTARHLAKFFPWLVLAACGKTPAAPADVTTAPAPDVALVQPEPKPATTDAVAAPEPDVAKPANDIATGMSVEVGVVPAAVEGDQFIIWSHGPNGYTSAWVAADVQDQQDNGGAKVLATRAEAVLFDGSNAWALQWRYTPFNEVACEYMDNELPGKKPLGPRRYYPWLAARALGADLPERKLLEAFTGEGEGETAKDGKPPIYVGEHWGRTIDLVGGEGARLFLTECDGGYSCGAHGETDCRFSDATFAAEPRPLDLPAVEDEVADLRKAVETGWVDGEDIQSDGVNLKGVYFDHREGELSIGYLFVADVYYAITDGSWSSYTQSRMKMGPPAKSLGLTTLPGPVRAYLKSLPAAAAAPDETQPQPRAFGWSAVPASAQREALFAAFKDVGTLAPPKPEDESADALAGASAKLAEGRKATKEKRYPDAIKAFDEAIAGAANMARAWSGRGYAKLLSGDLVAAKADFAQALTLDATPKFQAAVHFNLGELALRQKDLAGAKASFTKANELAPSDAAKRQLERLK